MLKVISNDLFKTTYTFNSKARITNIILNLINNNMICIKSDELSHLLNNNFIKEIDNVNVNNLYNNEIQFISFITNII